MQEKVKATWAIAVILIGVLFALSYFPSGNSTAEIRLENMAPQDQLGTLLNDDISATSGKFTN